MNENNNDFPKIEVPVTGPHSEYDFDQNPMGHLDRSEQVRRVVELGLRYAYEFSRLEANLNLDAANAQAQKSILEANRLQVMGLTGMNKDV